MTHLLALLTLEVAMAADLPPHTPDANAARADIPAVYQWNLGALFPDEAAWEAARTGVLQDLPKLAAHRGRLADPRTLKEALDLYFRLHDTANHVTLYANLRLTTAQTDEAAQTLNQKALACMADVMREAAFLRTEVLALSDKQISKAWTREPGLAPYRAYLENLRRRASRVLDADGERVLGLVGDNLWAEIDLNEIPSPSEDVFQALLADIPWPKIRDASGAEVQLTLASFPKYRRDSDRRVRKEAVESFLGTLGTFKHALAATLAGQAEYDVVLARARTYDTARDAYLDKDRIDPAVYDTLIATVNAHLEPLHRYVALRKAMLDLDEVRLYDLYVPLLPAVDDKIPFPEARASILQALQPLGPEYGKVLAEGLDPANGWVDLYPSRDKQSGAFSSSVYGVHPFVMMNYQDSVNDMSTLAHEYGHALHSYLSMQAQSYPDYRYVPFLAEIASTTNEVLLNDYLIAHAADDRTRASLLVDRLETIRSTIYRQTLFAEFEWALHRFVEAGTPVTADLLDKTYADLVKRYYGPAYVLGPNDGLEWAYVPHFYWKYYVFTYATGLSSGIAVAERVQQGGPEARDAFLGMLRAGCSRPPLEILRGAGVDLTKADAIEAALRRFDQTVTELEALLPRLKAEQAKPSPEPKRPARKKRR
ncbi:MAG: oligoendopeptidase F [Deltaproteobacteria bacterium]|nr:oligoendopeptidase F [Deltaproteobacteria bacterium]